jgi:hypothetical protein
MFFKLKHQKKLGIYYKKLYATKNVTIKIYLSKQLYAFKMIEKVNIIEHTNRFKILSNEITFTTALINHTNSAIVFMSTLLQSYKGFVITFNAYQILTRDGNWFSFLKGNMTKSNNTSISNK